MAGLRTGQSRRTIPAGLVMLLVVAPSYIEGAPRSVLGRLAELDGTEYIEYRNRLITPVGEKWDVSAATQESWESGLVALVVNARVTIPEKFREWDEMGPILRATGNLNWYRNREYKDPNVVGLFLERIWRPELSPGISSRHRERDIKTARIEAYEALKRHLHFGCEALGPVELWERVWAESDIRELRLVAASALSCGGGDGIPSQVDAIIRGDLDVEFKEAALDGIALFRAESLVSIGLPLLKDRSLEAAFRARIPGRFSEIIRQRGADDPRRTQIMDTLRAIAEDLVEDASVRCAALGKLNDDPLSDYLEVVIKCTQDESSKEVQLCAVHQCAVLPIEVKRKPLRQIIEKCVDTDIAFAAIGALSMHCEMQDAEFLSEIASDERLPEKVRRRAQHQSEKLIRFWERWGKLGQSK